MARDAQLEDELTSAEISLHRAASDWDAAVGQRTQRELSQEREKVAWIAKALPSSREAAIGSDRRLRRLVKAEMAILAREKVAEREAKAVEAKESRLAAGFPS